MANTMSAELTVPASYAAVSAPDFDAGFDSPDFIAFRSITGDYFYSFDGKNDHGMVFNADTLNVQIIETHRRKVWLKQNGGAASARVSAWTRA